MHHSTEERLIFGRSLGSAPWLMPRILPSDRSAFPTVICKQEGLLEISFPETVGDVDKLVRNKYGTRQIAPLKIFIEYGDAEARSRAGIRQEENEEEEKHHVQFKETFAFATPPTLKDDTDLKEFTIVLKELGNQRASDKEKANPLVTMMRLVDQRGYHVRFLLNAMGKVAKEYKTVIGRSTKQKIDMKALLSSKDYEMDIPITIHARVDMHLTSLEPKENSRTIQIMMRVKWTPPPSEDPPSSKTAPIGLLPTNEEYKFANVKVVSNSDSAAEYKPISGNAICHGEKIDATIAKLVETKYEADPLGPRQASSADVPPVKKVFAVYGINLPTQIASVCCRSSPVVYKKGRLVPNFTIDEAASFSDDEVTKGYEITDGKILETSATPQKDFLTGEMVTKSGDGTVPYYSLQQPQFWKKNNPECDVEIREIEGAEHRMILDNKEFHDILLKYVTGGEY
jgi:hypothetical protein